MTDVLKKYHESIFYLFILRVEDISAMDDCKHRKYNVLCGKYYFDNWIFFLRSNVYQVTYDRDFMLN